MMKVSHDDEVFMLVVPSVSKHLAVILALTLAAILAGCASTLKDGPKEKYPMLFIGLMEPVAEPSGRVVARISSRKGFMALHPEAISALVRSLKPLDIVTVSSKQRLSSRIIPGHFMHVAIYMGTARELRAEGYLPRTPKGGEALAADTPVFIESETNGVRMVGTGTLFDTDAAAVLRPRLSKTDRATARKLLFEHLGTEFDFHMNADEDQHLFCSELIDHVMPSLKLPRRTFYGRTVIMPTDVAQLALDSDRLSLVTYIRANDVRWWKASAAQMRDDIAANW